MTDLTPIEVQASLWGRRPRRDPAEALIECQQPAGRPPWCGSCDERTRLLERPEDGRPYRCLSCHPLTHGQQDTPAELTDDDVAEARFRREADRLTEWELAQRKVSL
jgi:hypothetical protein